MKRHAYWRLVALLIALPIVFSGLSLASTVEDFETIYSNENIETVFNDPTAPTLFTLDQDYLIQSVTTYHWNNGKGEVPGLIIIVQVSDYTVVGGWKAVGRTGYRNVSNAYWDVFPNIVLKGGVEYAVMPSSYETWAHNPKSSNAGFVNIRGIPVTAEKIATQPPSHSTARTDAPGSTSAETRVAKQILPGGDVLLGQLDVNGLSMALPGNAYEGAQETALRVVAAEGVPEMPNAWPSGLALEVQTGLPQRLDEPATLVYRYDPKRVLDPLLLCLGYYDGQRWTYLQAESKDEAAATVTFRIYHFSTYYPAQFKSELEAAKHYTKQFAVRKVMGENGGDARTASRMVADYMASKLGLSESEFAKRMLAGIAGDQDVIKIADEWQSDGFSNTGYEKVMDVFCGKVSDYLIENRSGLTAKDGVILTSGERGLKKIGTLIKVTDSGSKILGALVEGDMKAVKSELYNVATDNTGSLGKSLKYTLQGMQNTIDVWRDDEVEKAYQVYSQGCSDAWFGYGAIEAGDFDAVWDNMKGSARQLCLERIALENDARALCGMPPLSEREAEAYRQEVKEQLRLEFQRRAQRQSAIDIEESNLTRIFEELDKADMLDSTKVWYRGFGGREETLQGRMARMEHLIQRIYRDLKIKEVYSGPQFAGELNGRISAMAMSEMVRRYFAANTQAEAEQALQQAYRQFSSASAISNSELAGTYRLSLEGYGDEATATITIHPTSDRGGTLDWAGLPGTYTYADGVIEFRIEFGEYSPTGSITFERNNFSLTGYGTALGYVYYDKALTRVEDRFTLIKID